jgi:hypothetical protein
MNNLNQILFIIISAALGGLCGYIVGVAKTFREEKQRAYEEILPVVLKVAYNPEKKDEEDFGKALSKLWLYGSKEVTNKMDEAVSILHDPKRGNITEALQEAVAEMRRDIQILPWQKIDPKEVRHLYSRIGK